MKLTQRTFASGIDRAVGACRLFYFCGPDEGGIADAANRTAAALAARWGAVERIELAGADLRKDPPLLADEARSTSLFGDQRLIWVRTSGDEVLAAVTGLLDDAVTGWPVLILASGATDKSRIAKAIEPRADGLVAVFHPPEPGAVADAVRDMAGAAGLRMNSAVAQQIARAANLDTRIARSEIDKLALYLDASPEAPRTADAAALAAIGASCDDDDLAIMVNAVLSGDARPMAAALARMREDGTNPVGLVLALQRRAAQLAQLVARLGDDRDVDGFIQGEVDARRVFFRDKAALCSHVRRWRGKRLDRLVDRLISLHCQLLDDSRMADLIAAQALAEITRAAMR